MMKTEKSITPGEAAQILLSALSYCKESGLTVTLIPAGEGVTLKIDGLKVVTQNGRDSLIPAGVPETGPGVPE